ncbi:MAG: zinc dependent phospholipase C family protein, partial [Intestinibacillus sp.]
SVMYDEVMDKIRAFVRKYAIGPVNGHEVSVDLGEICHYMTDFFSYPHNDDIYDRNLLAHYIYEKRTSLRIGKRIDDEKFERWVSPVIPPFTLDALLSRIADLHHEYKTKTERHCIANDVMYICRVCTMVVLAVINITYESQPAAETAGITA